MDYPAENEFLLSLPDDALEAFSIYEERLRSIHLDSNRWSSYHDDQREQKEIYISKIIGYIQAHELPIPISDEIPEDPDDFYKFYSIAQKKITIFVEKLKLQSIQKQKRSLVPEYLIEKATKVEIHHHLSMIRTIIEDSEFTQSKRNVLFDRLGALSKAVDKDKTFGENIIGIYTMLKNDASFGTDKVNEALSHVSRIMDAVAKSQEAPLLQINMVAKLSIEGPKKSEKSTSVNEMADDIPF